ncbi:MAG: hypothetical protein LBQ52_01450 [Helicobacteraceae bacterium]|jgi:uncharacterized protein YydD (DUF2326 family)|nr:hypothetical protein [Helicobacteraceae bacterium]
MNKDALKEELNNMRSALTELESALNGITDEEDRLFAALDQGGVFVFNEIKKLQERLARLLEDDER